MAWRKGEGEGLREEGEKRVEPCGKATSGSQSLARNIMVQREGVGESGGGTMPKRGTVGGREKKRTGRESKGREREERKRKRKEKKMEIRFLNWEGAHHPFSHCIYLKTQSIITSNVT